MTKAEIKEYNSSNTDEYMTFIIGSMRYAIELPSIREILTYPKLITILPGTSEWVKGLINLRGQVVPILDIRIKFTNNDVIYNEETIVIAIITNDDRLIGLVVDKIEDVKKIDNTLLYPVSDMGSTIPSQYLKGYARLENSEMLVIMNIDAITHKDELEN